MTDEAADRIEALGKSVEGLQEQVGKLLTILDDWDKQWAEERNGGLTMHTYGHTPDWYVEAAYWSCYCHAPSNEEGI